MAKHRRKLHECPNCGTPLPPAFEFCPTCGQENHELKVPFRHMLYEFVEGLTHFDAKAWNTVKAMFHPGRITEDFLVGKRARYVPPVRLYIFVSIVFFFLLNALMNHRMREPETAVQHSQEAPSTPPTPTASVDSTERERRVGVRATVNGEPVEENSSLSLIYSLPDSDKTKLEPYLDELTTAQLDSVLLVMGNPQPNWFKRRFLVAMLHIPEGEQALDYIAHMVTRSLSILMFILMPFFALLLKGLFARKRLYYEHLIFSIHTHTAFLILFSVISALGLLLTGPVQGWIVRLTWLAAAVYLIMALRRVYHKRWLATIGLSITMLIPYFLAFVVLALAGILFGFMLH
ncbi:MAG TPA: DUF3667 domain-containing protein [Flavobacteriales bacterium]|jgi:hypothetical protein|nr:DUF3667 domain-containing protein [Flavobacteriales bacterium]